MLKPVSYSLCIFLFACGLQSSRQLNAQGKALIQSGDTIVFLGDSNTYAGQFVADFDAYLRSSTKLDCDVINSGLPSETCTGLSEPDHPFPRPNVHERVERVLKKISPDLVFICYGMNDGIYHPFNKQRMLAFQKGILDLIEKVKKSGARVVLLTTPPFDPLPLRNKNKLAKKDSRQFAWFLIYEDYDNVLEKYSTWILGLKEKVDCVIDIRSPINEYLKLKRETNPKFTMSGDGVHFNSNCHRLIADALIRKIFPEGKDIQYNEKVVQLTRRKMLVVRDSWLSETGHKRPGVKAGVGINEMKIQVAELESQIQQVLKKPSAAK